MTVCATASCAANRPEHPALPVSPGQRLPARASASSAWAAGAPTRPAADGRSWTRSTASPAHCGNAGIVPRARASRYSCRASGVAASSSSRPRRLSRKGWPRVRAVYFAGHREARAMSRTRWRSVSSPSPSTIALAVAGATRASAVAWKRAGADQRPVGPQGQGGRHATAVGDPVGRRHRNRRRQVHHDRRNGSVDRPCRAPCPPASVPCAPITSAQVQSPAGLLQIGDLNDQPDARVADAFREGARVAEGQHHRRRTVFECPHDHIDVDRPRLKADTPGRPGNSAGRRGSSRAGHSWSPFPLPSSPSPPPRETAAVRAPPADPAIGARAIGCSTPKSSVNAVDSPMAAISAGRKNKGKEVTHSLPLSTYSAVGGLRQGPGHATQSHAEATSCGNGRLTKCMFCLVT